MSDEIEVGLLRGRAAHFARALIIPLAIFAAVIASAIALTPALIAVAPVAVMISIFVALARLGRPRPEVERGALQLRQGSIWIGGIPVIPRADVREGVVVPHTTEGTVVRLVTRTGGVIALAVKNVEQAKAVLEQLGLDVAHHAATFTIRSRNRSAFMRRLWLSLGAFVGGVLAMAVLGGLLRTPALVVPMPLAAIFLALSIALPTRVTVGTDGLVLRRGLGRRDFVPLDGIEKAVVVEGELSMNTTPINVELRGALGEIKEELFVDARKEGPFQEAVHAMLLARAEGLAERINEAIDARKQAKTIDPAALARGGRNPRVWVDDLRTLLARAETFRAAPLSVEALTAIVEDASAPAVTRAAAAAALSNGSEDVRARVRVAAEATAAPHLRIALEAAAEGDPERIADAIAEMETHS
ncbi:MAG: hypothetical protein ACXWUG_01555 [Polyangiales bacterium]